QPALERRHREGPRDLGARWPIAALAELAQQGRLLTAVELRARQRAEHLRPKQRDAFGVVLGFEGVVGIGHASSVSRLLMLWEGAAMVGGGIRSSFVVIRSASVSGCAEDSMLVRRRVGVTA